MSVISITLKAIDQYSGVLTGLNQGFELVGKALDFMGAAVDATFAAIDKGVSLAAEGGKYAEMRRQFNNVADSFGVDGQRILDDLDKVTLNMTDMGDAVEIAGRAVTAGLSEEQIGTAFEFIKRRTELTGESFEAMSKTVFDALQGGRFSVLRQMGLVIESGAGVKEAMQAIEVATKNYGDAGYHTGDKLRALAVQQKSFTKALGVAVNETPAFQKTLTSLTDTVISVVAAFDPRPVTEFFQAMAEVGSEAIDTIVDMIPGLRETYESVVDFFKSTQEGSKNATATVVETVFEMVKGVASGINTLLDVVEGAGIVTVVEQVARVSLSVVRNVVTAIPEAVGSVLELVMRKVAEFGRSIAGYAQEYPTIAKLLGVDTEALIADVGWLEKQAKKAGDFSDSWQKVDDVFQSVDEKIAGLADGIRTERIDLDAIDGIGDRMKDRINDIDFSKTWGEALSKTDPKQFELPEVTAKGRVEWEESETGKDFDLRAREIELADMDRDKVAEQWARVNWPAEFESLGEFIFEWTMARARGEEFPLAILSGV